MRETDLASHAQAGSREAFGELVGLYTRRAYGYFLVRVRNQAVSEDLAQEAFVKAFLGIRALRNPDRFGPWFFAICRNVLRKSAKASMDDTVESYDGEMLPAFPGGDLCQSRLPWDEAERAVRLAIDGLRTEERELIRMRYYGRLSYAELASATGLELSSVKGRLFRIRASLALIVPSLIDEVLSEPETIQLLEENIMHSTDLVRDAAFVFARLCLADQVAFAKASIAERRFDESTISAIGSTGKGRDFLASYGTLLKLAELIGILGYVDRGVEFRLMEALENEDENLAEAIKRNLLVFEDIFLCDAGALRFIVDNVEPDTLAAALAGTLGAVRGKVLAALSPVEASRLREAMADKDAWGTKPDGAQEEIVQALETWCYDGTLTVEHGNEEGKPTALIRLGRR